MLEGFLDRIRAATGGRVLVVDDDGAVRDFLGDALRAAGYAVEAAPDAGAALDLLWSAWDDQPDVILLDLVLPAVDGRGFGELYRELPVRHAPVVLMSAVAEVERIAAETGPRPACGSRSTWTSCSRRWHGTPAPTRAGPRRTSDIGRRRGPPAGCRFGAAGVPGARPTAPAAVRKTRLAAFVWSNSGSPCSERPRPQGRALQRGAAQRRSRERDGRDVRLRR